VPEAVKPKGGPARASLDGTLAALDYDRTAPSIRLVITDDVSLATY